MTKLANKPFPIKVDPALLASHRALIDAAAARQTFGAIFAVLSDRKRMWRELGKAYELDLDNQEYVIDILTGVLEHKGPKKGVFNLAEMEVGGTA